MAGLGAGLVIAVAGFVSDRSAPAAAGLAVMALMGGGLALHMLNEERQRHERVESELGGRTSFLEALVESIDKVTATRDPDEIVACTCAEAEKLFGAKATLLPPTESPPPAATERAILLPLVVGEEELGAIHLVRDRPFERADVGGATVLAQFAARAIENARLLAEAEVRETERTRLTDQVLTAEQDERRRLALFLHDTAVQSLAGVALLLDGGLHAVESGDLEQGITVIRGALKRHRETIGSLRELSFELEPVVLRDQGFGPAVRALAQQLGLERRLRIELDVAAGEALAEQARAGLYQIIREALHASIRRGPPTKIEVVVSRTEDGGTVTTITDDAPGERRARTYEDTTERARTHGGTLELSSAETGGTMVRVVLPPWANGE
jgi:signal transduction histidine kinase